MRRHLTYANVVATLALVFAMSGGALAAKHYLVNSTSQINPKVIKKLRGHTGKTGKTGAPGAVGKEGAAGKEGKEGKAASIAPLNWEPMLLLNGWKEFLAEWGFPSYSKDAEGFVHLSGAVDGSKSTNNLIATLPAGFRPTREQQVWLRAPSTNGEEDPRLVDLWIHPTGEIEAWPAPGATEAFVGLEGLEFYAG